jgi:3-methyl-2-oxobutanoate hydroxymethyltransferase
MPQRPKRTAPSIRGMKGKGEKIVCITAYDAVSGALGDAAGADLILVGDSVGNVVLGYDTTIPVTMEDMVHHTAAAAGSVESALVVADMPFGSYQASVSQAVENAVELVQAGAEAVKLEGPYFEEIAAIAKAGIPVMGHVGMTPQSIHQFGGFKVQGKGDAGTAVVEMAEKLSDQGVFAIVLELIPAALAARVTQAVDCPTIGIGAGAGCDGQIQVFHDLLGLTPHKLRHAKRYIEGFDLLLEALEDYAHEVREGKFPGKEHSA